MAQDDGVTTAQKAQTIYLRDYTPFSHVVEKVDLTFDLDPSATRVKSVIKMAPRTGQDGRDLFLHGEMLDLIGIQIDGADVPHTVSATGLTIKAADLPKAPFTLSCEVEIAPAANTALEGLYMSNGMYCTQCEAEGFRKITYYPDRPDVMAPFDVRINGAEPVLLSNGNPIDAGAGFATWSDPWPKPAYLFALVAGDLIAHPGHFTTKSGRDVALNIYVRPGDEGKCAWGVDSLIRSMAWDETAYGREYDLDIFNIVAVDDFNMGAMENKGLNIFNSSCVLASSDTATDANYDRIEGIIAHEYFHNWTGNRITCRDWFQLCLKEGLTVFRDQQFSGDARGHGVKRIEEVSQLRGRQFREDGGPLAHPVRPESFVEINNFYTATVYEKGAEVIGMLKALVGDDAYRAALDLYFDRHDGDAATIEDWIKVFEDATGRDLTQFKLWYSQAGTPRLQITESFSDGTYTLTARQSCAPTPGQPTKAPLVIPIAIGLLAPNGDEIQPTTVLELTEPEQSFEFKGLGARPVASILRGFSAPVVMERKLSDADKRFLLAHDTDPFNRYEAGRDLARDILLNLIAGRDQGTEIKAYTDALGQLVFDDAIEPAFRALILGLPSQDDLESHIVAANGIPDPSAVHAAREDLKTQIASAFKDKLPILYKAMDIDGPFNPNAEHAGKRALRLAALRLISRNDGGDAARAQFDAADNMTLSMGALEALLDINAGHGALKSFRAKWSHDRLVMDKWFMAQVLFAAPETCADIARSLTQDPAFDWRNPNRFRAVVGALAANAAGFHHPGGASYELLADCLIKLDDLNPQTTARMSGAFETWRRYDASRQALIKAQIERILAKPNLSRDVEEKLTLILGA